MGFVKRVPDSSRPQACAEDHYLWRVPPKPVSVQVPLRFIDRLEADVMDAFRSVPKRGAEIGGVLLGRRIRASETTVVIDDYELVTCEHANGPSYHLSESDARKLEETVARWRFYPDKYVVGFFRSHTRDGLQLEPEDGGIITRHFCDPADIFLVVKPSASLPPAAGIFIWEEGKIHRESSYRQFPFNRRQLLDAGLVQAIPQASVEAAAPKAPPAESAGFGKRILAQFHRRFAPKSAADPFAPRAGFPRAAGVWLVASAVLALGGLEYHTYRMVVTKQAPAAVQAATQGLRVEQNGGYLHVSWPRGVAPFVKAREAVLRIADGASHRQIRLDRSQLRGGSIAYLPMTTDVTFRLDVNTPGEPFSESLRVLAAAPALPFVSEPSQASAQPAPPAVKKTRPEVVRQARAKRRLEPRREAANAVATRAGTGNGSATRTRARAVFFDDGL